MSGRSASSVCGSALYAIGGGGGPAWSLPPELPGTIREREHGLDFELGVGLTLRVAWPGPSGYPA